MGSVHHINLKSKAFSEQDQVRAYIACWLNMYIALAMVCGLLADRLFSAKACHRNSDPEWIRDFYSL